MPVKKVKVPPKKDSKVNKLKKTNEKKPAVKPNQKTTKSKAVPAKEIKASKTNKIGTKKREILIAPAEVCFWVNNGPALQSLFDLRVAFKMLSEEQYSYHANKEKNDFASWVAAILKDEACAEDLTKAKNMKAALKIVEKHLEGYEK